MHFEIAVHPRPNRLTLGCVRDAEGLELCPLLPVSSLVLQVPGPSAGTTFPVTSCCVHQTGVPVVLPPSTDGASGCSVPLAAALKASWNGALSQLMCSVGLVFPKLVSGCSLHLLEIPELSGILCVCVCVCVSFHQRLTHPTEGLLRIPAATRALSTTFWNVRSPG